VNISSSSVLYKIDKDHKFEEEFQTTIKSTATEQIQGFELVETWEDLGNYWVYYRLSKAKYSSIKEEKKRNAQSIALDYYEKGKSSESNPQQLGTSLGYYLQGLYSIREYLTMPNRVNHSGKTILLGNELYAAIQGLADQITLSVPDSGYWVNRRLANGLPIPVSVIHRNGVPLAGIPIKGVFALGDGLIPPGNLTNQGGHTKIIISKIYGHEKKQQVALSIDLASLSQTSSTDKFYDMLLKQFVTPTETVGLTVNPPSIFITAEERILGTTNTNHQISNKLKNILSSQGFVFTNDKNQASLWMDLTSDTQKGPISGSIHITYLTMGIKVVDLNADKEVYSTGLDRIKGYSLDYKRSSREGYEKALELLEKDTLPMLIKAIL